MEKWTVETLIGLLGAPAAIAVIVSWLIERSELFQELTPREKCISFLAGCMALPWAIAGVGIWLGMLTFDKVLVVETFLCGAFAFYASQVAHVKDMRSKAIYVKRNPRRWH